MSDYPKRFDELIEQGLTATGWIGEHQEGFGHKFYRHPMALGTVVRHNGYSWGLEDPNEGSAEGHIEFAKAMVWCAHVSMTGWQRFLRQQQIQRMSLHKARREYEEAVRNGGNAEEAFRILELVMERETKLTLKAAEVVETTIRRKL